MNEATPIKELIRPYQVMNELRPMDKLLNELNIVQDNIRKSKEEDSRDYLSWRVKLPKQTI